ncbi:epsin-3 isoform X4 [Heterocephalus glaber]|uniref:Epsin-3 isoform X4 n=1 Tax=Heterocephalus glaber TaxID=10181 RepID=A0AAX6RJ73_HETGA|nr:epsin-3 isoform X4 [Heterocephalus glaber]
MTLGGGEGADPHTPLLPIKEKAEEGLGSGAQAPAPAPAGVPIQRAQDARPAPPRPPAFLLCPVTAEADWPGPLSNFPPEYRPLAGWSLRGDKRQSCSSRGPCAVLLRGLCPLGQSGSRGRGSTVDGSGIAAEAVPSPCLVDRVTAEAAGAGARGARAGAAASSPRYASDLEQARPQTSGEEELQLQLALAMSREEAEKPVPPASHRDEDLQLQLALRLSRQEHEKEVKSWRGEDSPVANGPGAAARCRRDREPGREERKEEEKLKTSQSSILDLADIFVPTQVPPSTHCSADPWDIPGGHAGLRPSTEPSGSSWGPSADPWSPVPSGNVLSRSQPWDLLPTLSSEPWGRTPVLPAGPPATDPWAPNSPHHNLSSTGANPWGASTEPLDTPAVGGVSTFDPFTKTPEPTEAKAELQGAQAMPSGKLGSPVDLDLFGEPRPSSKQNGTKEPDTFSLGVLGEALSPAPPNKEAPGRCTPESFLGPSASSLVNLDSLVKVPQVAKTQNPFLTGLSAPSSTNPFGAGEQVAPTLNQMRTGSPVPIAPMGAPLGSMSYSASLPLPLSSVPVSRTLPASASAFPQACAFAPLAPILPPPLLPMSSSDVPLQESRQVGTNPFL